MSTFRFAIMGAGNIAHQFCDAVTLVEDCEVSAIASKDLGRAQKFAEECSVRTGSCRRSRDESGQKRRLSEYGQGSYLCFGTVYTGGKRTGWTRCRKWKDQGKLPAGGTGSDGGKHPGWNSDAF